LQQTIDIPFDTLKAQLLAQISVKLNPMMITYDDYSIEWTVPRIQPSPLALATDDDYKFMLQHASKHKEPQANIIIKACSNKVCLFLMDTSMCIYPAENRYRNLVRNSEERRTGIVTEMQRQALGRTPILMVGATVTNAQKRSRRRWFVFFSWLLNC